METIGKYTVMLVVAACLIILSYWLKSDYLASFFADNAILLGGAIFSIHAASVGILMSQLVILKQREHIDFSSTIRGIRHSLKEALLWLAISVTGAVVQRGLEQNDCPLLAIPYINEVCLLLVVFSIIALLAIVLDTVNAILMCLEHN